MERMGNMLISKLDHFSKNKSVLKVSTNLKIMMVLQEK